MINPIAFAISPEFIRISSAYWTWCGRHASLGAEPCNCQRATRSSHNSECSARQAVDEQVYGHDATRRRSGAKPYEYRRTQIDCTSLRCEWSPIASIRVPVPHSSRSRHAASQSACEQVPVSLSWRQVHSLKGKCQRENSSQTQRNAAAAAAALDPWSELPSLEE